MLVRSAGPRGTVAFTGAGVSTESGIPDFRSPGTGLWTQNAPISYQDFLNDPEMRRESWRRGANTYPLIAAAVPNPAHLAIAEWHRAGLLEGLVTQNIDALHQRAGVPDGAIAELHGNAHRVDGQPLPADVLDRAAGWLAAARLCLVIGSSLVVYPAAGLPELTLQGGGALAIVNATETHLDPLASYVSRHPSGLLLGQAAVLMRHKAAT